MPHTRDGGLLIAQTFYFFPVENAEFPVFDHGTVGLFTGIGTPEDVAEFVGQFFQVFRLSAKQIELPKRCLPLGLPLALRSRISVGRTIPSETFSAS